jgi:hypothetical protein
MGLFVPPVFLDGLCNGLYRGCGVDNCLPSTTSEGREVESANTPIMDYETGELLRGDQTEVQGDGDSGEQGNSHANS